MAGFNHQHSQNAFKNDGSFLEVFKRFQQQQQHAPQQSQPEGQASFAPCAAVTMTNAAATTTTYGNAYKRPSEMPKSCFPTHTKRKNRPLKTGVVKKVNQDDDKKQAKPTDAWSVYMDEVKRYQDTVGEQDSKTRPLVK